MSLNFIDWLSFKDIFPVAGSGTSLAEFCAQYSDVQTNWCYTIAGLIGIIILLMKKNKKWYWYAFLIIYMIMSVTSVGMHTANYGEFVRGQMTTKLLMSYIDMSLTEYVAWSGVCCFAFEFYEANKKKRNIFLITETAIMLAVIITLTIEVFVLHDRPLYISKEFFTTGVAPAMDGKTGGLSIAEFGCFLTAVPILYLLISNFKSMEKNEKAILLLTIGTFLVAFIDTSIWGDNEIANFALGNYQGHSIWHMLGAIAELEVVFWVDTRETNKKLKAIKAKQPADIAA
ncbi:MAG: hypothetical protein MJ177_00040 [Clostridia bacterium]|nr:hypothetical protein [Clostridia bacterium]